MLSTNQIMQTPFEIAKLVLNTMACTGGELWLFAFEPREMADAIEVRPEIATKLQIMAMRSEAIAIVWSSAKAILDTRAACQAVEEILK